MPVISPGTWPIDPTTTSGTELATYLNELINAVQSTQSTPTRPVALQRGGLWAKTLGATDIELMFFDGTTDYKIGSIIGGNVSFGGVAATTTPPTGPSTGDTWVDTSVGGAPVLKIWNGTNWVSSAVSGASLATQGEAQTGTNNDKVMTPLRVNEAIQALTPAPPVSNNATITVTAGTQLTGGGTFTVNQAGNSTITLNHEDTSSQGSLTGNANAKAIQNITLDSNGHITNMTDHTITNSDIGSVPVGTSGGSAPSSPVVGQVWYDTGASAIKIWGGSAWKSAGASMALGAVGTYALCSTTSSGGTFSAGSTHGGGGLRYGGYRAGQHTVQAFGVNYGGSPSGTWRAMSHVTTNGSGGYFPHGIFIRIS